jgi:nucleoside-diphosphate-sugar epimerase
VRALITGGAGFIGSHLSDLLLREGHEVHVLDDLSTGSLENLRHLRDTPGFECTVDTAHDPQVVSALVDEVDMVFHLAAAVGVELIVESPVRTIETNVHCTEVVLAAANRNKKPVLIASTSEVYGKTHKFPFAEGDDLVFGSTGTGRWAYACSKAIDEFLALAYWKERQQPVAVVRLFNTVGPRQTGRYGMVIPRMVGQALKNQPITVYGDGTQSRCFCHVSDVVTALTRLMTEAEPWGEVFNIGTTEEVSMGQLAEIVKELAESSSEITHVPYEDAYEEGFEDMQRRVPDTSKIRAEIGWEPTMDLRETLTQVIASQRGEDVDGEAAFAADTASPV